jgi:NADH-quinone oxidoreductase subunit N
MMPDLDFALRLSAPESTLAVGGLVLLMLGSFLGEKSARLISILSVAVLVAATAVTVTGPLGMAFNGAYVADPLAVYGKALIFLSSAVAIVLGDGWMRRAKIARFEYPVLIVLASAGMGMMASSGDLISLYVGIELHSLALYVLAAYHRDDLKASEAGLKYFVLGALSSGLLLYGASLIYGFTGSMRFDEIAAYAAANESTGLIFGLVFLICGLAFKVSAAPFHMWTPDVYEGAPTPVVALFATAPKVAAMVLIARTLEGAFGGSHDQWAQVLILISLISFAVGAFGGLVQKDLQRLLAYHAALSGARAGGKADREARQTVRLLQRDAAALSELSVSMSSKVSFLMDATLGLINLEQNQIIKIFTVASVLFMPPTLIASIYGMNVKLPAQENPFAFLLVMVTIILSAIVPIVYFKRKKLL